MRLFVLLTAMAVTLAAVSSATAQDKSPAQLAEQTHFSAESERVDHPVPIPPAVLQVIGADPHIRTALGRRR